MGGIREFNIIVGPETSTPPTGTSPSNDADVITKEYADDTYAEIVSWGDKVASNAALKAVVLADRSDNQVRWNDGAASFYFFDSSSTATDNGDTILIPDDAPVSGRWSKISGGSSGSSGTASGLEVLAQKTENEKFDIITEELDNSVSISGRFALQDGQFTGTFLRTVSNVATTAEVVWNAKSFLDSDHNYDSATGWAVTGAGATLTATNTAGEFYVGAFALKFDKDNSATEAGIRYTRGAQDLLIAGNTRVFAKVKLPSVTGLSNLILRVYADTTSNFTTFTATLQSDGSSFAVGENLVFWDVSTGGSAGGSGWVYSQAVKYVEFAVTASSAGQTYTGIILDSLYASYRYPEDLGVIGSEWTVYDNSNKANIRFDDASTVRDGKVTLVAATGDTFVGGISGASRGQVRRTTLLQGSGNNLPFDTDSALSGEITLEQDFRIATFARETVTGTFGAFVDMPAAQFYKVTAVGGSTIDVEDVNDQHLNLLSGDNIDIFRPYKLPGKTTYVFIVSRALSANSSASGGTTTLTLTTASIAVGDIACKRHLSELALSVVGATADENFSAMSLSSDPNGKQLIEDGLMYPRASALSGHYLLGGATTSDATINRRGFLPTLTVTGATNLQGDGFFGRFSATGFTSTAYLSVAAADSTELNANPGRKVNFALWVYRVAGAAGVLISKSSGGAGSGYEVYVNTSNELVITNASAAQVIFTFSGTGWHHIAGSIVESSQKFWVDGVLSPTVGTIGINSDGTSNPFRIGYGPILSATSTTLRLMDIALQGGTGYADWTQSEVDLMYNGGLFKPLGTAPRQRYIYMATSQSGQKISLRGKFSRSTTAVRPSVWKAGTIKTT